MIDKIKISDVVNLDDKYKISIEVESFENIHKKLIDIFYLDKENKIRQALMALGWIPPVNDKRWLHKLQRYAMDSHGGWGEDSYMAKCCDGEYVLYEDVLKLLAMTEKGK